MAQESKKLIILRGLPGSGKSTLAQELGKGGAIFSTDEYWGPDYNFDVKRLPQAHRWNENRATKAMQQGISPIVIDNVNNTFYAPKPYVKAALEHGYQVEFQETQTPWRFDAEELTKRNKHGVPRERIDEMLADWEPELDVDTIIKSKAPWEPKDQD